MSSLNISQINLDAFTPYLKELYRLWDLPQSFPEQTRQPHSRPSSTDLRAMDMRSKALILLTYIALLLYGDGIETS